VRLAVCLTTEKPKLGLRQAQGLPLAQCVGSDYVTQPASSARDVGGFLGAEAAWV